MLMTGVKEQSKFYRKSTLHDVGTNMLTHYTDTSLVTAVPIANYLDLIVLYPMLSLISFMVVQFALILYHIGFDFNFQCQFVDLTPLYFDYDFYSYHYKP